MPYTTATLLLLSLLQLTRLLMKFLWVSTFEGAATRQAGMTTMANGMNGNKQSSLVSVELGFKQ
jgi:hypothetical protein